MNKALDIQIFKHEQIPEIYMSEIIKIKSKQWNYSNAEHRRWLMEHLKPSDLHMFLRQDGEYVAYLNLVDIVLDINNISSLGYGIGNVCAIERGYGYGFELMQQANQFLIDYQQIGLLFCREALSKFYQSLGWYHVNPMKFNDGQEINQVFTYNCNPDAVIHYSGSYF